jgi:hypothetical protein
MKYYSKLTGGFYDKAVHGDSMPSDVVEIPNEYYCDLLTAQTAGKLIQADANGFPIAVEPAAPSPADLIAANIAAIQARLDSEARSRGYDNILSACTYAMQPSGAPFQAEGAAFLAWRSDVWAQAYATLADVQAGQVAMPTPADAVAAMPALLLP